ARVQVSRGIGGHERWRWASGYRTWDRSFQEEYDQYESNHTAIAECAWSGEGRTTGICLHPWMAGSFLLQRHMFRTLYDWGLNVVQVILPFHGPRAPSRLAGALFPGRCPRRTNEGFGQTIWDARALVSYLEQRGSGPIGAVGMSLGG